MRADADRHSEQAIVTFDPARASPREMVTAINGQTYYRASLVSMDQATELGGQGAGAGSGRSPDAPGSLAIYGLLGLGIILLGGGIYWLALRSRRVARVCDDHGVRTSH